jgi:hypothetical protein
MEEREIHWSHQLEELIAKEGEKCRAYAWVHQNTENYYNRRNNLVQIPVIVFSTLSGTASVGSATLFSGNTTYSSIGIGLISIAVGILNTLGGFFGYARKAEAHRIAYIHYSKLFSKISIELALPRHERMPPSELLLQVREAMERLAETTPSIPEKIIHLFTSKFKDIDDIAIPPETNGLEKIQVYRPSEASLVSESRKPNKYPNHFSATSEKKPESRIDVPSLSLPESDDNRQNTLHVV